MNRLPKVILLTGFEAFGESKVNPSILACRELESKNYNSYMVAVEEIPLRYKEIQSKIERLIEAYKPSAIVGTGQGGGPGLSLERVAINIADARTPYNCGAKPIDEPLNPKGPAAYFTKLPIKKLVERLREEKIPSAISNSAGTFGCNQLFYHLMDFLARKKLNYPAGFIHVPLLPEQTLENRSPSMPIDLTAKGLSLVLGEITKRL